MQLALEPVDVLSDAPAHSGQRVFEPVALGDDHLDHLAATGQQGVESGRRFIGQRPRFRAHALGEQRQSLGVDQIGLCELPGGAGEVAHLAGIRHHDWQPRRRERRDHRPLVAASGLEDHQGRGVWVQVLEQGANAHLIVGDRPPIA